MVLIVLRMVTLLCLAGSLLAVPASNAAVPGVITQFVVEAKAISPDGDGASEAVEMTLAVSQPAAVTLTAVNKQGRVVRRIWSADMQPGPVEMLAWDGTADDGTPAPDGRYRLIATTGRGSDQQQVVRPLRIDTSAPSRLFSRRRIVPKRNGPMVVVPLRLSEPALLEIRLGSGRTYSFLEGAGRQSISLRAPDGWFNSGSAGGMVQVRASDDASNLRVDQARLVMPLVPVPISSQDGFRLRWPVAGVITSRFGPRWGRMHEGIDVAAPSGQTIVASAAGRVSSAGWMGGYGKVVVIDHGAGVQTLYAHQSQLVVAAGQQVEAGTPIGMVGSTGHSTGPHLHFEVKVNGLPRDPLRYLL